MSSKTVFLQFAAVALAAVSLDSSLLAKPAWVLSGNEAKIDLASGVSRVVGPEGSDSLTLLDFSTRPPKVTHVPRISNTVLGPPSNIAFTPDGRLALIADSIRLDPQNPGKWLPHRAVHLLDLTVSPPQLAGSVDAGLQPSGISVSPDGSFALVANRADGSVTRLNIRGSQVSFGESATFTVGTNEVSDVAISPDQRWAVASVREGGHLRVLHCDGGRLVATDRKISTYGRPYRVVFSPDGQFVLSAGQGAGSGTDMDALTVIRRRGDEFLTEDFVPIGSSPETIEISPDGRLVAALLMNGSNLAPGSKGYTDHGQLVLVQRRGNRFIRSQVIPTGRIPEGVAFTPDGSHLVVQCHPDRELRVYPVRRNRVGEKYQRIEVPGFPSSLRAMGR